MPGSVTRVAGLPLTLTLGEPWIDGPTALCGHPGQLCESFGTCDWSPRRACGGIQVNPPGTIVAVPAAGIGETGVPPLATAITLFTSVVASHVVKQVSTPVA